MVKFRFPHLQQLFIERQQKRCWILLLPLDLASATLDFQEINFFERLVLTPLAFRFW